MRTSWQWNNLLHAHAPEGQQRLRINMDETSVRMYQQGALAWLLGRRGGLFADHVRLRMP